MPPRRSKRRRDGEGAAEDAPAAAPAPAAAAPSSPSSSAEKKPKAKKKSKKEKTKPAASAEDANDSSFPTLGQKPEPSNETMIPPPKSSLLSKLLLELQALSKDKARCTAALQSMLDGKVAYAVLRGEEGYGTQVGETKATDFHPTLASYAAALAGEEVEDAAPSPAPKGKKRGAEKKGSDKKGKYGGEGGEDGHEGSKDAHVIMAATHAINTLLRTLKEDKMEEGTGEDKEEDEAEQSAKDTAIALIALSHPLIVSLVNDRPTLEAITKASRGGVGSPRHNRHHASTSSPSVFSMDVDDESPNRGRSLSPEKAGLAGTKRILTSHAKAVVGGALASGVMGALWGLEALAESGVRTSDAGKGAGDESEMDEDKKPSAASPTGGATANAEDAIVRKSLWSALIALEAALQLNPAPKLLSTTLTAASATSPARGGSDHVFGGLSALDFDGFPSATGAMGGVSSTGARTSGANNVSVWNALLQRIMLECRVGFHLDQSADATAGASDGAGEENTLLERICRDVTEYACSNDPLLSLVLGEDKEVPTGEPPAKKSRRAASKRKPAPKAKSGATREDHSELSAILSRHEETSVSFDCHVSVRRWAALAFGWLGRGQKRLLHSGAGMLTKGSNWAKLMELPAAVAPNLEAAPPVASTKKKKKAKKKEKKVQPLSGGLDPSGGGKQTDPVRGNLALILFVSCMADMVFDAGTTGGLSPPSTGWMDEYVKAIVGDLSEVPEKDGEAKKKAASKPASASSAAAQEAGAPVRRSTRKRSKTTKRSETESTAGVGRISSPPRGSPGGAGSRAVWMRPDVRNEATVLARLLVDAHCQSLIDNIERGESSVQGVILVNDDESMAAKHYPFIQCTLETLGRTAASSSLGGSDGKSHVLAVGSAVALGHFSQSPEVFDAKLLSLAVAQLLDCLGVIISSSRTHAAGAAMAVSNTSSPALASLPRDVVTAQRLNDPLDIPTDNARISLFVRAQIPSSLSASSNDNHSAAMASLLQSLLDIVRACYHSLEIHSPQDGGNGEGEGASSMASKKKGSKKKKKRKSGELASASEGGLRNQSQPRSRKTLMQCALASDALDALAKLLACNPQWNAQSSSTPAFDSSSLSIRSFFNSCLSDKAVLDFVQLGFALEDKFIHQRLVSVARDFSGAATTTWSVRTMLEASKIFESWERQMFKAHAQLALTIGQSRSNACRAKVFQAIVAAEVEKRGDGGTQPTDERTSRSTKSRHISELWPLCLSAAQHALVSSLVLSSNEPSTDDSDGEGSSPEDLVLLCDSFLNSMEAYMANLSNLPAATLEGKVVIDGRALISLRDSRLFAVAISKLGRGRQKQVLSRCIGILHSGLQAGNNLETIAKADISGDASSFVARGVALCAAITDLVLSPGLQSLLGTELASTDYSVLGLRQISIPSQSFQKEEFQGLFGNGQSPSVPYAAGIVTATDMMNESDYNNISAMLRSALAVGFRTSSHDGCHLLFSSWNAIAKLSSWTPHGWEGPALASVTKKLSPVDRIVQLREDMCWVNVLRGVRSSRPPDSLLTKVLQSKAPRCRPNQALNSALTSAEEMLSFLTAEMGKKNLTSPSLDTFAYYEALPLFASFLISVHSRPGANDMGAKHRLAAPRQSPSLYFAGQMRPMPAAGAGAYRSHEDSDMEPEDAGGSVMRLNSLTRLHEACLAIGAAPCYPDWLDAGCRLHGYSTLAAQDSASDLMNVLTKFGVAVLKCYFGAMQDALRATGAEVPTPEVELSSIALQLVFAQQQQMPPGVSDSFYKQVSSLCQLGDDGMLKRLVDSISSQHRLSGTALFATSAHRIKGAENHRAWKIVPGEHRANDQWETLLSETLRGSSLSVAPELAGSVVRHSDAMKGQGEDALVMVNHWRRVLYSIVNALVPSAALLRFGIKGGKGRSTHTLCEDSLPGSVFSNSANNQESSASAHLSTREKIKSTVKNVLSFLSCISAYSSNDEDMRMTCRAAAGHLLESSSSFGDLTSLWSAKITCKAIEGVVSSFSGDDNNGAGNLVIETTLKQFADDDDDFDDETGLSIAALDNRLDEDKRTILLACMGLRNQKVGKLIGNRADMELAAVLSDDMAPFPKKDSDIVRLLMTLLCGKATPISDRARVFVAEMLLDVIDAEFEITGGKPSSGNGEIARSSAAAALDELSKEDLVLLVKKDICCSNVSEADGDETLEEKKQLSEKLIRLIGYLTSVKGSSGDGCKILLSELIKCIGEWDGSSTSELHTVKLLCLLASRFGTLNEVGKAIVTLLRTKRKGGAINVPQGYVDMAKDFFEFAASLNELVKKISSPSEGASSLTAARRGATDGSSKRTGTHIKLKNGEEISRTCSFVETGEGFTEQHWYNCYTCGLLWDKGCCSLCARVCHKGHDVGYSRKSSFFCDCGAEVATAIEQNRTPCKCLSPVSEDVVRELYENESEDHEEEDQSHVHSGISDMMVTDLIAENFVHECQEGLRKLAQEAKASQWRESILELFGKCYQNTPSLDETTISSLLQDAASQPITDGAPDLQPRSAKPLALKRLYESSMLPIRAAKASALQSRMISSAASTSHIRKGRSDLMVQAIAADDRGRLFIAESSTILFCNAIPSVNVRGTENTTATHQHLSRSQLNILGSDSVKFPVSGMIMNAENNRHLLVWGVSKACVCILSKSLDSFERIIELKLNLDADSECLVKCDWMPQSEIHVVAVCGTVVHVFDLKRTEKDNSCNATTHYALAYEDVFIRSATLIGSLSVDDCSIIETKLALLLDTGRLYFINLTIDEEGNLEDHGESYIEIGSGVSWPSGGIRRYSGSDPIHSGATSTSFGEGAFLAYLRQSNLLLYQCVSSCCIAMLLDDDGGICGSFELLPNTISADELGGHYGVAGPYTHFQELGTIRRGQDTFYRFSCIGRSTRSTQPRAIIVEFNERDVSVRELAWPTNCSAGLGFISSYSFVGSATFSMPYFVGGNASEGTINDQTQVLERAYLTLLSSSGSLLWFGEDCGTNAHTMTRSITKPLTFFEQIINVSELEGLELGGDFVGKDPAGTKRKLSLNSTDYAISPSRDGCTLTARLQTNSGTSQGDGNPLAIVAVRVLVGSMPDLIPREISIMGRPIKLKKNMKRWYDFPLTDEETLLAMRNGFVTIYISSCDDSSSAPILDSVEVYAQPRSDLKFLKILGDGAAREGVLPRLLAQHFNGHQQPASERLIPCIRSSAYLTRVNGQSQLLSSTSADNKDTRLSGVKATIGKVLQQTALDSGEMGTLRYETVRFLIEAESDEVKRTLFVDDSTLRGLMAVLQCLGSYLRSEFANVDIVTQKQGAMINGAIEILVHIVNVTISIARTRGGNYRKIMLDMINEKACQTSIALEGKKVLDFCQYLKALHGASLKLDQPTRAVSELILMEIACSDSKDFAQFATLAEYLLVDSNEIVKACCSSISSAVGDTKGSKPTANSSSMENQLAYVTYQCDACLVFPITEQRYTLGGDDNDIDLCKKCYDEGISYARRHDQHEPVIINGRTLGADTEEPLTCQKIWQMTSKPIALSSLEQVEKAKKAGLNPAQATMKLSSNAGSEHQGVDMPTSKQGGDGIEVVKTEGFRSQIFTQLLGLMAKSLEPKKDEVSSLPSTHVLQLVIELVLDSGTEELKTARGKEMAAAFTSNLPNLVNTPSLSELVVILRSLSALVLQKREVNRSPPLVEAPDEETDGAHAHHHHHKDKTDPRFVCDVHGVPAVRRRCSHGVHKDRRFYVCGLERKHRCNYFKWSSDIPENTTGKGQGQMFGRGDAHDIFVSVQDELQRIFWGNKLQDQLCGLVSCQFEAGSGAGGSGSGDNALANEGSTPKFPSTKSEADRTRDTDDGVNRTLVKFGKTKPMPPRLDDDDSYSSSAVGDGSRDSFLCSALDLLSLLAPKREAKDSEAWSPDWDSVLCEIISSSTSNGMRNLAKVMLQRLCGDIHTYHRIRDNYIFAFQFRKLLQRSQDILDSALVVREQARQCGSDWRDDEVTFETLPASGLLGVEDLISEDWYALTTEDSIATALDELLPAAGRGIGASTKARTNSWRTFCGLPEMVTSNRKGASVGITGPMLEMLEQIYRRPPIVSLLWLCSCLRGSNQVKALSLVDIALEDLNAADMVVAAPEIQADDDENMVDVHQTADRVPLDPEQSILQCFTVDDLVSFIKQFVLNGRSKDLRSVSSSVARKLALRLSPTDKNRLFACLINGSFQDLAMAGSASSNFLDLLRLFVEGSGSELEVTDMSLSIATSFMDQMTNLNHYFMENQGVFGKHDVDSAGICDLSDCVHCHKQNLSAKKSVKSKKSDSTNQSASSKESEVSKQNLLPEQVRPYQRCHLETSTAGTVSSAFSSYNKLKFRVALSQVHVNVSDPRGRLVKTVGVYFSPRQVSDVNVLKSSKYTHLWQKCGTLSLPRGGSEATCMLRTPVVAANLKFTYEEFYEKASPRCTRQVHNAHGVCGNCGEVAFQCRKCRHINYDQLDAFLCVECGYCTAGGFTYDLTAGIALNATAIVNEDDFARSMTMLRIATKRQADLRNSLKKKVMVAMQQQRKIQGDQVEHLDELVLYGPQLKRAFLGGMPKSEGFDEDEDKKPSGSSRTRGSSTGLSERASSTTSRARSSLLSLARSLRSEGGDSIGSRGDFLRQALLGAGSSGPSSGLDSLDDDLLNALASSASSSGDPLSRIVANISARTRDEGRSSRAGAAGTTSASRKDAKSKLSPSEERHRLHTQMREAERECYELNRRIDAWNRLNKDCLAGFGPSNPSARAFAFMPSACSSCSPQVAYQLLSLLHAVYCANISQSEHTVTQDLVKVLLKEPEYLSPKLKDLKRRTLIALASTSEAASKLVLAELKSRLVAVQDVTSAEVLGKLVQLDFPAVNDYIDLAMSTLSRM